MTAKLAIHFLAYSGLLGATSYQSFYAGFAAYKALPYQMFSKLQHQIFPGYFMMQTVLSSILLVTPPFPLAKDGMASLGASLVGALVNLLVIMPATHKLVVARDEQMEREGKGYKDPTASDEMKAINKKFSKMHGISMLFNLMLILSVFYYAYYFTSRLAIKA